MVNEWITVSQALELLQYTSRTSLWQFAIKHNVRVSKPMGRVYYNRADLLKAINNKAVRLGF